MNKFKFFVKTLNGLYLLISVGFRHEYKILFITQQVAN
jgi:hypothetical protein